MHWGRHLPFVLAAELREGGGSLFQVQLSDLLQHARQV